MLLRPAIIATLFFAAFTLFDGDFNMPICCADENVTFIVGDYLPAEGGGWDSTSSPLNRPFGIAFFPGGSMAIVELEGGRVFEWQAETGLRHVSGDGSRSFRGDGLHMSMAAYNGMHNCAINRQGTLFISDTWNHCVRSISFESRIITTIAGRPDAEPGFSGDGSPATEAQFNFVMCVSLTPDESELIVTDLNNRRVRLLDLSTGLIRTVAGNGAKGIPENGASATLSPLVDPRAAVADSIGNLYILERGGHALRRVLPDGTITTVAGNGTAGYADGGVLVSRLNSPKHLCVAGDDSIIIADDENGAIRRFNPRSGELTTVLGRGCGDPKIQLSHPHGVTWHAGSIYVADSSNNRILKIRLPEITSTPSP